MRLSSLIPGLAGRPFDGRHMVAIVCAFFGTIIAVNVAMAFFAIRTFPGLVVDNSYVASQQYNELLDAARAQEAEGWQAALASADGVLRFTLADRNGVPQRRLTVTAVAGRPSTTLEDRELAFAGAPEGYLALDPLPPGLWEVDLTAAAEDGTVLFRRTEEIFVRPAEG